MDIIGLIGGMSWESTVTYYQVINEETHRLLGGQHNARSILHTVDFADIEACQREDRWDDAAELLGACARSLTQAGARFIVVCANTMHKVAPAIAAAAAPAEFIHIVDPTAAEIRRRGLSRVALLGTRYTMEQDFYRGRLEDRGLRVMLPQEAERKVIHRMIYEELCHGRFTPAAREALGAIIQSLRGEGAEGIILGCTELGLLLGQDEPGIAIFDTARLHALAAVHAALGRPAGGT